VVDTGAQSDASDSDRAISEPDPRSDAGPARDKDGAVNGDAGDIGDAGDPYSPQPPAGAVQCGGASFTASDSQSACAATWPHGGMITFPHDCGTLSMSGGTYEVWCAPTTIYFWIRFDGVTANTLAQCPITLDGSVYNFDQPLWTDPTNSFIGVNTPRGSEAFRGSPVGITQVDHVPRSFVIKGQTLATVADSGTANLWVALGESACSGSGAQPVVRYMAGVAMAWP
jgi:hypothetical protein